jgi:hypothetical protein
MHVIEARYDSYKIRLVITWYIGFQEIVEVSTYSKVQKNKIYFFDVTCDFRILNEVSC